MSEAGSFREQDPGNFEADQASIALFEQAIQEVVAASESWSYHPEIGGSCSVDIEGSKHESLQVEYRVPDSKGHPIEDWFFKEPISNVTSFWIRFNEEHRLTQDRSSTHCEVEQIWVTQTVEGKQIRRRVYDYEQFNFSLMDEVEKPEYHRLEALFTEKQEVRKRLQRESDVMEEATGLNRITNAELAELTSLLKKATQQ